MSIYHCSSCDDFKDDEHEPCQKIGIDTQCDTCSTKELAGRLAGNERFMADIFGVPYGYMPKPARKDADEAFRASIDDSWMNDGQ